MPQQQAPWLEGKYGWNFGEGGWNTGVDEDILKFSFMFDRNVDSIVASLPAAVNGQAHYLTTDNRLYFAVGTTYFSTPVPKWFTVFVRSTGQTHQYNGTSLVQVDDPTQLDSRLGAVELTVSTLGTAAFQSTEFFATQAELDVASATAASYTDVLRSDLADSSIVSKGAGQIGFSPAGAGAASRTVLNKLMDTISVKDFGATGDGVTDDATAINAAIAALPATGGAVYFPRGVYFVSTSNINHACLWVNKDNVTFFGDGAGSIIETTNNQHVPVHVSPEQDLSVVSIAGAAVENFVMHDLSVAGTGVYQNFGLAYGRGVLLRKVRNAIIRDNFIFNMSMLGICVEQGEGNFLITNNIVGNCKYTAINFNGRAYQSIISNNICYGSDGTVDSIAIQATGNSLVLNNTVYGSPGNFAQCGGIVWGEGGYSGTGAIRGNLVKHCRFGIKSHYHGPCQISDNTIINCMTTGGITLVGGTMAGFPVASADNLIANNTLINNSPYQIECNAENTMISSNKCIRMVSPVNPSAPTEPDAILDVVPEYSIYVTAAGCSVVGNTMRGSNRGLVVKKGVSLANCEANDVLGLGAAGLMVVESATNPGTIIALTDLTERRSAGNGVYQNRVFGNTKPSQGFWRNGDIWERVPAIVGQTLGEVVIGNTDTVTTATSAAGSFTITVAAAPSAATGNLIGIALDNGAYHWTSVASVAGLVVTLVAAIPVGRSVLNGAEVNGQQWRALALLA